MSFLSLFFSFLFDNQKQIQQKFLSVLLKLGGNILLNDESKTPSSCNFSSSSSPSLSFEQKNRIGSFLPFLSSSLIFLRDAFCIQTNGKKSDFFLSAQFLMSRQRFVSVYLSIQLLILLVCLPVSSFCTKSNLKQLLWYLKIFWTWLTQLHASIF